MGPPVEKKKKISSSADDQQQQKCQMRSVRWICSDVWMDIFPLFDHAQLCLKLALISPRFDVLVDTYFDGKSELTIWRPITIQNDIGTGEAKLCVLTGIGNSVNFPLPDCPLPRKIRFEDLRIEYIDHSVIKFLRSNQQIFARRGTNLGLSVWSPNSDVQPILDVFVHEIWPIFAPNIRQLAFPFDFFLDNLCRLISPTILSDLNLNLIKTYGLLPELLGAFDGPNATCSAGHALSKWLHTPRKNGQQNRLLCIGYNGTPTVVWINNFKKAFLRATTSTSACYTIKFNVHESTLIVPFELVNGQTQEKLTLKKERKNDFYNNYWWLLKRCPISEKVAADQWENDENSANFNIVQFALNSIDKNHHCIGSLCPPAAGQIKGKGRLKMSAGPSGKRKKK